MAGSDIGEVLDGNLRFEIVQRVADRDRTLEGLSALLVETPSGRVPLHQVAQIEENVGPNQISGDNGRRRTVISANSSGGDLSALVERVRGEVASNHCPLAISPHWKASSPGAGGSQSAHRGPGNDFTGDDFSGAVQLLLVNPPHPDDHGQHSIGAGGLHHHTANRGRRTVGGQPDRLHRSGTRYVKNITNVSVSAI